MGLKQEENEEVQHLIETVLINRPELSLYRKEREISKLSEKLLEEN